MAKTKKSNFAILGMLALIKRGTGYDLKKHMERSTQYFWKETFSSIYPVLEDLETQQLITRVEEPIRSERKTNTYSLTPKGQDVLKDWLIQQPENMQLRNELLLKLYFGNLVPTSISIEHLKKYKSELSKKLITYQAFKKELSATNSLESSYWLITLDHGIRLTATSLEWCTNSIKTLQSHITRGT